jgi:arginase
VTITVLDAPSNLGLRAPAPGVVPGCYKLPWALRDRGLLPRLDAVDAGAVVPGRYDVSGWSPGDGAFNAAAMAEFSVRLADRVEALTARGFLLVLGGDCSIALGTMLGLRRRGRYGLVYVDAHTDFRHVGNATGGIGVGAVGGEALAAVTGRAQPELADLGGLGPYVAERDVALLGLHEPGDPDVPEVRDALGLVLDVGQLRAQGTRAAADAALAAALGDGADGVWVHVDADVLDPSVMPAVDSPEPDGLTPAELTEVLAVLASHPRTVGLEVAIYDPDLDPDGSAADVLTDVVCEALVRRR